MPRSKSLSHYPTRYAEIVQDCAVRGKRIEVPVETTLHATKLRGHFYAFVGAVKRDARLLDTRGPPWAAHELGIKELAAQTSMVLVSIEECLCVFENRERSWQAQALLGARVVDVEAPKLTPRELTGIERLLQAQKEKDNASDKD